MKPKTSVKALTEPKAGSYDDCGTPPYAVDALLDVVGWTCVPDAIWEPALGEGLLARAFINRQYTVYTPRGDFFKFREEINNVWLVTNPPYSDKYRWIHHALSFGVPTALLMPVEAIGAEAFWAACRHECGFYLPKLIFVTPRINFKMPNKGWDGTGAQFPTCWYLWNFPDVIPCINYVRQTKEFRDRVMREVEGG